VGVSRGGCFAFAGSERVFRVEDGARDEFGGEAGADAALARRGGVRGGGVCGGVGGAGHGFV